METLKVLSNTAVIRNIHTLMMDMNVTVILIVS